MRSYNRYLAVAARVVRRSLKEGPRLQAERRGEMDLRFAKWEVSYCVHQCLLPATDIALAERETGREQEPCVRKRKRHGTISGPGSKIEGFIR
jgi:hypothetical protein